MATVRTFQEEDAGAGEHDASIREESGKCIVNAATTTTGWKRKRPTQHDYDYDWSTTPDKTSSHSLSQQPSGGVERSIESPAQLLMEKQPTQAPITTVPLLLSLPDEGISSIASYLSLHDVRSLATTCHYVRSSLIGNRATRSIWLNAMKNSFPSLLNHIYPSTSESESTSPRQEREMVFVDDHQLPIAGLVGKKTEGQDTSNEINLPLLMGLLPSRYPQSIDPSTLSVVIDQATVRLDGAILRDMLRKQVSLFESVPENNGSIFRIYKPFHSFELAMVFNDGVAMSCDGEQNDDSAAQMTSQSQKIVPVVQFRGTVGLGNCCIRSDHPFPPNCRVVYCDMNSCNRSCRGDRSSAEIKENGPESCGQNALSETNLPSLNNPKSENNPTVASPIKSSQRSRLFSLLKSLSNHYSNPDSSSDDDTSEDQEYAFDEQSMGSSHSDMLSIISDISLDILDALDEEEVISNGGLSKCNDQGLRPFVIPTIFSDTAKDGVDFVVDVTPRLVAYFEVTIIKQHEEGGSACHQQSNEDNANNANIYSECVAIGLSTSDFRVHNKMPGWNHRSFGYHGDDGGIFHDTPYKLRQYAYPKFGAGDTVGCGLKYDTREIFFTKNGQFLGCAFDGNVVRKEMVESGLYPTVGVDAKSPIFMNYGNSPFRFDLNGFTAAAMALAGAEGNDV